MRRAQTVGTRVAAADDDHVLAVNIDRRYVDVALLHPVGRGQVLHRLMNATELTTGDRQVAGSRGTAGQDDRVVRGQQDLDVDAITDDRSGAELGALGLHLGDAPIEVALLHLELGNAVAQQAADAVGAFEHDDVVTGPRQLLRGGQPGWTRADHDDPLAGLHTGELRLDPTLVPGSIDDLHLDLLDRHRIGIDAEHARCLARCGTQTDR